MQKQGTTSLPNFPTPCKITFNIADAQGDSSPQQPKVSPIANFASNPSSHSTGSLIDVNSSFIAYGVKNGLIRVIYRKNVLRTLLRGHDKRITDVAFFGSATDSSDMLGSVGGEGNVLIWRVFAREDELLNEKLLEVQFPPAARILWHPFNSNRFILMHRNAFVNRDGDGNQTKGESNITVVATVIDTTRLLTLPDKEDGHAVCTCSSDSQGLNNYTGGGPQIDGTFQLVVSDIREDVGINDLSWSELDVRNVLTAHNDGCVRLWDLRSRIHLNSEGEKVEGNGDDPNVLETAEMIMTVPVVSELSLDDCNRSVERCMFLPGYDDASSFFRNGGKTVMEPGSYMTNPFLTFANRGSEVTLWSPFTTSGSPPMKVSVFQLSGMPGISYNISLSTIPVATPTESAEPPSTFVLFADDYDGSVYALHLSALWRDIGSDSSVNKKMAAVTGFDYVVPFRAVHPIYSWTVTTSASTNTDALGLYNIDLFCVQSKAVQLLSLLPTMCNAPPMLKEGSILPVGVTVQDISKNRVTKSAKGIEAYIDDNDDVEYDDYDDEDDSCPSCESENTEEGEGEVENNDNSKPPSSSFSNWLGNLSNVREGSLSEKVTVASSFRETTDSSDLLKVPLPNAPSAVISNTSLVAASPPAKEKRQFLSPVELLSAPPVRNVIKKAEPSQTTKGVKGIPQVTSSKRTVVQKNPKPISNKTSKKTSKVMQKAPGLSKDGKISILKKEDVVPKKSLNDGLSNEFDASSPSQHDIDGIIRKALSSYLTNHEAAMISKVQQAVQNEVQSSVIPALCKTVSQTLEHSIKTSVQSSLTKKLKGGLNIDSNKVAHSVSKSLNNSLINSFQQMMEGVIIPSYESGTRQMLSQVSTLLETESPKKEKDADLTRKDIDGIMKRMDAMAKTIEVLIQAISKMQANSKDSLQVQDKITTDVDQSKVLREEILAFIATDDYESAFTQALSASDSSVAVFACQSSNIDTVLGNDTPKLSQPILLCLMQQLGARLSHVKNDNLKVELSWLQNIAVVLDPGDESINKHVADVCQQLTQNINSKMAKVDPSLRRPLQMLLQVIRGIGTE